MKWTEKSCESDSDCPTKNGITAARAGIITFIRGGGNLLSSSAPNKRRAIISFTFPGPRTVFALICITYNQCTGGRVPTACRKNRDFIDFRRAVSNNNNINK